MASGFIPLDDGYTEHVWLNEIANLCERLEFSYRPMLQEEIVEYGNTVAKFTGMKVRDLAAKMLAAKIKSWDQKDHKGEPVPITPANMLRLKEVRFQQLFDVISTQKAPDGVVRRDDGDAEQDAADLVEAANTGKSVASIREARQQKNS